MTSDNNDRETLASKVLRKELLILLVGLFIFGSGFYTGKTMQYFWGVTIIIGAVVLHFVRKKDWAKHWEEQERLKQAMEERRMRQQDKGK